jgi:hypothetical protein
MAKKRISDAKIGEALRASGGAIVTAAEKLGYSRSQLWRRMEANPALSEIVQEERESLVDLAEAALKTAVVAGEAWAVCFCLKCLGKERGYIERQQVEHSGGTDGKLVVVEDSNWYGQSVAEIREKIAADHARAKALRQANDTDNLQPAEPAHLNP